MEAKINPDLQTRAKTAAVLIVVFLVAVFLGEQFEIANKFFTALIFILVCLAGGEFCKFPNTQSRSNYIFRLILLLLPSAAVAFCALGSDIFFSFAGNHDLLFLAVITGTLGLAQALSLSSLSINARESSNSQGLVLEKILADYGREQLGFLLLGFGGASAVAISAISPIMSLILVTIVAVADSSAYFAGRYYGKEKIAPIVSPKKTVVGTIVGIVAGGLAGMIFFNMIPAVQSPGFFVSLLMAMIISVCSQAGDYGKSIVKRRYDIKDFGTIFPGHGGVLDRLDGILGSAPLMLILVVFLWNP